MGISDIIKQPFNIGAQFIISLEAFELSQHDVIKGVVRLTCPEYMLSGESISIELIEFRIVNISVSRTLATQNMTERRTIDKKVFYNDFKFAPASMLEFPFELRLPRNCRLTTDEDGWYLEAGVDIPKAMNLKAKRDLKVGPAKELLYIVKSCEELLNFEENKGLRKWDGATTKTHFHLTAPEKYQKYIDYLVLNINVTEDGSICGELQFNLQEKSFGDYFRALRGDDFINKEFYLDSSRLYKETGQFDKEYVSKIIYDELRGIMRDEGS